MNDEKGSLSNILSLVDAIFYKDIIKQIRGNERMFYLYNHDIYRELLKIKDRKYIKLVDKSLINYIYNNDFLKFNINTKDPLYFTKFIRLYIDKEAYGNTIYHNMTKYIYFTYLKELKLSGDVVLNELIHQYSPTVKALYHSGKINFNEVHNVSRLLVYLLTYLYMNREYVEENDKIFYDTVSVMFEDNFYDNMKMNGVFEFKELKEEDDIKIYFIEKAVEEAIIRNKKSIKTK